MKTWVQILIAMFLLCRSGQAQGFINLDFEFAKIIPLVGGPYYPYSIAVTNALPGWTVYEAGNQVTQITYNDPTVGSAWATLWATNGVQISGKFSVVLTGSIGGTFAASISQTGLVPVSAYSLLFETQRGPGPLVVSLGGQNIPFFALSTGANYTLYGGDISAFAGQVEQLTFSASGYSQQLSYWNIDNIQFSSSPVPEPSALALSALGGLILAGLARRGVKKFSVFGG
ncbi:MAG TPA: PEP-CTERM sorting domain-containing protein [Verrucomicrobiae bacterium]